MGFLKYHSIFVRLTFFFIVILMIGIHSSHAQEIKVIKSEGSSAVINAGGNFGFKLGGLVRVMRMRNGMWKEISRARITQVAPDMSRIEVVEGAPMVTFKPGDIIIKFSLSSVSKDNVPASNTNSYQIDGDAPSYEYQKPRGIYVAPTLDVLLPQGNMKRYFDDKIGYGAMLGFRFQRNFDISVRFMFAAESSEWSFWNLQLLGRLYEASNLFADIGYGICYPSISVEDIESSGNLQAIRMGFVFGVGYPLPVSLNKQFEIGFLYHYYPNFGKNAGQFLSVHGRLIIKS